MEPRTSAASDAIFPLECSNRSRERRSLKPHSQGGRFLRRPSRAPPSLVVPFHLLLSRTSFLLKKFRQDGSYALAWKGYIPVCASLPAQCANLVETDAGRLQRAYLQASKERTHTISNWCRTS